MAKEYIEREALEVALNHRLNFLMAENGEYDHYTSGFDEAVTRVENVPAADVAPVVHGRWTIAEDDYYGLNIVKCSVCHEEWCFEEGDDVFDLNYHYCPNCGAKMGKEVADDKKQPEEAPGK